MSHMTLIVLQSDASILTKEFNPQQSTTPLNELEGELLDRSSIKATTERTYSERVVSDIEALIHSTVTEFGSIKRTYC